MKLSERAFEKELTSLINKYSLENKSYTPDYILAEYLLSCLKTFNKSVNARAKWHGHESGASDE